MRYSLLTVLLSLAPLGGCLEDRVMLCKDGGVCPEGTACDAAHQGCVLPEQIERCRGLADMSPCIYREVRDGACYEGVCLPSGCGNGRLDDEEVCDDGNRLHNDGCAADCRSDETCGNGVVDLGAGESCEPPGTRLCRTDCVSATCGDGTVDRTSLERCDLGTRNSDAPDAACRPNCQPRRCGDGVQDSDETCDDGNNLVGDGCSSDCRSRERCGNGIVDVAAGESCEPPGTALCRADCVTPRCGDGTLDLDAFEQCDDGARNSSEPDAACRPNCQPGRCGDGVRDSGEVCDDQNLRNGDGCSHDCRSTETCGNGYRDPNEPCDDGNLLNHDGCSSRCLKESPTMRSPRRPWEGDEPAIFDGARGRFVSHDEADTCELDAQWEVVISAGDGVVPASRTLHGLVWDPHTQKIVLFGGRDAGSALLDQTWTWDGATWIRMNTNVAPTARERPSLAYDPVRRRVVMFGGVADDGPLGDTWEWDGTSWTEIRATHAPAAGAQPMAFDPRSGRVAVVDEAKLWWWMGNDWLANDAPPPTRLGGEPSMVFDRYRDRLVLFLPGPIGEAGTFWELGTGGWVRLPIIPPATGLGRSTRLLAGHQGRLSIVQGRRVWEWADGVWKVVETSTELPTPAAEVPLAYDPLTGTILMAGVGKTWRWGGSAWVDLALADSPQAFYGEDMAFDVDGELFVVTGGYDGDQVPLTGTFLFDGRAWRRGPVTSGLSPRNGARLAYDAKRRHLVMFGGLTGPWPASEETWWWHRGSWTLADLWDSPPGRMAFGSAYDPINERVVIVGGLFDIEPYPLADLWSLDDEWIFHTTTGPTSRDNHTLVYDANHRSFYVFGGFPHDLWEMVVEPGSHYGEWRFVETLIGSLGGGYGRVAVYDALRARTLFHSPNYDHSFSYSAPAQPDEACRYGFDTDGDSLIGCDDPDCWPFCTPLCPPGAPCDLTYPHCGDGECNEALETCRMCPEDCGACPALCGDFFCDAPETVSTCPGDCTPH